MSPKFNKWFTFKQMWTQNIWSHGKQVLNVTNVMHLWNGINPTKRTEVSACIPTLINWSSSSWPREGAKPKYSATTLQIVLHTRKTKKQLYFTFIKLQDEVIWMYSGQSSSGGAHEFILKLYSFIVLSVFKGSTNKLLQPISSRWRFTPKYDTFNIVV